MSQKARYGIDAPHVIRNMFIAGAFFLIIALAFPRVTIAHVEFLLSPGFLWPAGWFIFFAGLMLLYSLVGKFRHRDRILAKVNWTGAENVLDVGAGRGLLLIGAAKRLTTGHATGIDIWSNVDMGGNSAAATQHNLMLENIEARCTLISQSAAEMTFPDNTFDVIVSNLCIHNIYDKPTRLRALHQIVRVLKPGGIALISDYKRTGEYADEFRKAGLIVDKKRGSFLTTFPPLTVIVARKPM